MDRPDKLLTLKEVARIVKCSRRQVYRLVETKRLIAPIKVGTVPRWYPMDVDCYLHRLARGDFGDDEEPEAKKKAAGS